MTTVRNATLARWQFLQRLMEIQCGVMLIFRSTGKLPVTREGLGALRRSMEITPRDLAQVYELCGEREIVTFLADLKAEELFIGAELERRLLDKKMGTVLI